MEHEVFDHIDSTNGKADAHGDDEQTPPGDIGFPEEEERSPPGSRESGSAGGNNGGSNS